MLVVRVSLSRGGRRGARCGDGSAVNADSQVTLSPLRGSRGLAKGLGLRPPLGTPTR